MSPRFPIFSLPPSIVEQILEQLRYTDLFEFAQLSKRAFSLVQNLPESGAGLNVSISSTSLVGIYSYERGEQLEWYFYARRDAERYGMEDKERVVAVKMETVELVFAKTTADSYDCAALNSIESVVQFAQYIDSLFNISATQLELCPSKLHHLEAIQSVETLRKSRCLTINEGTVNHENMRRVLAGFDESDRTRIFCNPAPHFTYGRTISVRDLVVWSAAWFKGPMLLNLVNCESVCLRGCQIAEEHLNTFLRKWLNKTTGCGTIKRLSISSHLQDTDAVYVDGRPQTWDMNKIVRGLASFELPSLRKKSSNERRFCRRISRTSSDCIDVRVTFDSFSMELARR